MKIQKKEKFLAFIGSVLLALLVPLEVNAIVLNGGFDEGVGYWNDDSQAGTFSVENGIGILETRAGNALPFSAVAVQGDDGLFGFESPLEIELDVTRLSIDLSFERFREDIGEDTSASSFTDSLTISFFDEFDPTLDLALTSGVDFIPTTIFQTFIFDISKIAGRTGALAIELHDENDGFDSRVKFDNVSLVTAVPLPTSFWLFGSALLGLFRLKRSHKT